MSTVQAIESLKTISSVLERHAGKPEHQGTSWATYLEQMSFEMHKHANELTELSFMMNLNA
jgi:hypothetical protein